MSDHLPREIDSLGALRREIDAVDEQMHDLLMRRGAVIERLIEAKGGVESGSAFRPGREAQMLRRLAGRHRGAVPLAAVEHIWREIIGTFTQLQAPFRVHATRAGEPAGRDLLRFHFGFSSPIIAHDSAEKALAALRDSRTDLGAIVLDEKPASPWWRDLSMEPGGIKVIAHLPFLTAEGPDWPRTLIVGPAAIENPDADILVFEAEARGADRVDGDSLDILARSEGSVLVASVSEAAIRNAFMSAGAELVRLTQLGSYCAPPTP